MGCHIIVLVITSLCLFAGLAAIVVGTHGDYWYVVKVNVLIKGARVLGLWRTCVVINENDICSKRSNLLTFDKNSDLQFDLILAVLIGSSVIGFIGAVSSLFLCCCQRNVGAWRCCSVDVGCTSFLAALGTLGAVSYNEYVGRELYKYMDHGWSNIIVWVGGALQLIGSVLAYILICASPTRIIEGHIIQSGTNNIGYEMR